MERDSFFTATLQGQRRIVTQIPPDRTELLDGRIRQFLKAFDIVKIKVYTWDRQIIYSTDRGIIGERDLDNRRLGNALSGRNDSKLVPNFCLPRMKDSAGLHGNRLSESRRLNSAPTGSPDQEYRFHPIDSKLHVLRYRLTGSLRIPHDAFAGETQWKDSII
jgi:hypothetical protein